MSGPVRRWQQRDGTGAGGLVLLVRPPSQGVWCRKRHHGLILEKSIYPRSTLVLTSSTVTLSPTSRPFVPRVSFPSTGGSMSRTHVPLSDVPVAIASNRSPIWDSGSSAAADFLSCRSSDRAYSAQTEVGGNNTSRSI